MANPQQIPRPLTPQEREVRDAEAHQARLELAYRRQPGISRTIVQFLMDNAGRQFAVEKIADGTGLPLQSVKSAMSKLVKEGHVQVGELRGMYFIDPASLNGINDHTALAEGDSLEVMKVRPDGDVVALDRNGHFWVATSVDI